MAMTRMNPTSYLSECSEKWLWIKALDQGFGSKEIVNRKYPLTHSTLGVVYRVVQLWGPVVTANCERLEYCLTERAAREQVLLLRSLLRSLILLCANYMYSFFSADGT